MNLSSTLKTGIAPGLIKNSSDPFKELNEMIFCNQEVAQNISNNSSIPKCVFDIAHLDIFTIKKISDFLFTKTSKYFDQFINKTAERIDELSSKYSGYVFGPEDIILVHTCSSGDSLYLCGKKKDIKYPFISLSNEDSEFFIATARNYIYSYSRDI